MPQPVVTIKEISQRIQDVRRRRGLTQDDVARRLEEPVSTYARWDGGQSQIASTDMARVARALDCPVAFLYGEMTIEEMEAFRAIDGYAALTLSQQRVVQALIEALTANPEAA